jgi:hypothetical protein
MTENQWCALLELRSYRERYKAAGDELWHSIQLGCRDIKKLADTDIGEDILEGILCTVSWGFSLPNSYISHGDLY